jgi:hypothetical protein
MGFMVLPSSAAVPRPSWRPNCQCSAPAETGRCGGCLQGAGPSHRSLLCLPGTNADAEPCSPLSRAASRGTRKQTHCGSAGAPATRGTQLSSQHAEQRDACLPGGSVPLCEPKPLSHAPPLLLPPPGKPSGRHAPARMHSVP